jgi:hypothetical protein
VRHDVGLAISGTARLLRSDERLALGSSES